MVRSYAVMGLNKLCYSINEWARGKGFWDGDAGHLGWKISLIHSEVTEMLEAVRKGDSTNEAEEMADIIIRCLDYCAARKIDIEGEIIRKMNTNEGRPFMHGKKF